MNKRNFPKVSILITNFNKEKYILKALKSSLSQTYKNSEVLLYDDNSTDNSLNEIKKLRNYRLIINNDPKKESSPQNQILGVLKIFKKSKGKYIFLLDGDDYIKKNKISFFMNYIKTNNKIKLLQDIPKLVSKKKKIKIKKKNQFFTIWPTVIPTSSICVERKYFKNFLKYIQKDRYPDLEIDSRIIIYTYLKNELNFINKSFTYYRDNINGITSKYNKFSYNWWKKRYQAYQYMFFLMKKFNLQIKKGPDYVLTKIVNFFI